MIWVLHGQICKKKDNGLTKFYSLLIAIAQTTSIFVIFWGFLMFYQFFFSPQVKRCAIITYKHAIYILYLELLNDLRLSKYQESVQTQ